MASIHYRGGASRGTNLRWEINGTEGDLEITAASGHLQIAPLTLRGAREGEGRLAELPVPASYRTVPAELQGPAVNVAEVYAQFALGDRASYPVADFDAAVGRHRLIQAIEKAAAGRHGVAP